MNISIRSVVVVIATVAGFLCPTGNTQTQRSQTSTADTNWIYILGEVIISASCFEESSLLVS